jgi:hypothetical protein
LPPVTAPIVGACGIVVGVIDDDADDALEVLKLFDAVVVNVYDVPLVSPETVIGDELPVPVIEPGDEVTKYEFAKPPPDPEVIGTDTEDVAAYVKEEFD